MGNLPARYLSPKDPAETRTETFEFAAYLGGETIGSADAVTCSVYRGTDASPGAVLNGASSTSGTKVTQSVTLGVADVDYKLRSRITTNTGRKLVLPGILPVRTA